MALLIIVAAAGAFVIFEVAWLWLNGSSVSRPDISRQPQTIGSGPPLTYVVLGDSTAISQGGEYEKGYAMATAAHIARTHTVTWINLGISGARAQDVTNRQFVQAVSYRPDVVLIAVGANDVTHLTPINAVRRSLRQVIDGLQTANPEVRILLTGSPDMGSPPRIPQPLRTLAGHRTASLNRAIASLADGNRTVFAPVADKTGPLFRANHRLFAADNFHPTTEGYQLWTPVLTQAIDQVL